MRSYLFVFEQGGRTRQEIIDAIDGLREIENWYAFMAHALCVVSELNAQDLSQAIRTAVPEMNFIVTRLDRGAKGGWLRKSVWDFIDHPEAVAAPGR